jgi:hypothetical protein
LRVIWSAWERVPNGSMRGPEIYGRVQKESGLKFDDPVLFERPQLHDREEVFGAAVDVRATLLKIEPISFRYLRARREPAEHSSHATIALLSEWAQNDEPRRFLIEHVRRTIIDRAAPMHHREVTQCVLTTRTSPK